MEGGKTSPPTTPVCIKKQGKVKCKGNVKLDIAYQIALKWLDNIAFFLHKVMQPNKHPANRYGGSTTARHGRKGNWMRIDKKG
jgi:hypothetical protein